MLRTDRAGLTTYQRILLPDLIRRVAVLTIVSAAGIALLAPLAARSAAPEPPAIDDALLPSVDAPATTLQRGMLTARGSAPDARRSGGVESLAVEPIATPGVAPMSATLQVIPTPKPTPAPVVRAPAPPPAAPDAPFVMDGSVWDRLAQCEASGNWAANTGNGYYGGLQFNLGTWQSYGGGEFAAYPHQATREEQILVAERLHAARGFQPWPACRVKLGLP
jgi:hypothetical protein